MSVRLAVHLAECLLATPSDAQILVRRARSGHLGTFEAVVADVASRLGRSVEFYEPTGGERGSVYQRDYALVEAADVVYAYFAPGRVMDGGTGHIVEAALARDRLVVAWVVNPGSIERVGEYEPS